MGTTGKWINSSNLGKWLIAASSMGLAGCGASQQAQCKALLLSVSQTQLELKALHSEISKEPQDIMKNTPKLVEAFQKAEASFRKIALQDETLRDIRDRYVTMLKTSSSALEQAAVAVNQNDERALEASGRVARNAAAEESALAKQLINYCGAEVK